MEATISRVSRSGRCALLLCTLVATTSLLPPALSHAANGDCAQPSSNGLNPVTSDCLFILRAAVGALTCSPVCICAPKGTLPPQASDALLCLRKSVGQQVTLQCPCAAVSDSDDFNDNSKDPQRWGADDVDGNGVLVETSQRLEFRVSSPTVGDFDYVSRPWVASVMPYSADWEVQIDLANTTVPTEDDHVNSFGISVFDQSNDDNEVFAELYASSLSGPPARYGFYGELDDDGSFVAEVDTTDLQVMNGAVRITFSAADKVLTLFYDVNPGDGYDWMQYGSFGVDGSDGEDANAQWGMSGSDRFTLAVYGYSEEMTIAAATMHGDNFQVTGGVQP